MTGQFLSRETLPFHQLDRRAMAAVPSVLNAAQRGAKAAPPWTSHVQDGRSSPRGGGAVVRAAQGGRLSQRHQSDPDTWEVGGKKNKVLAD